MTIRALLIVVKMAVVVAKGIAFAADSAATVARLVTNWLEAREPLDDDSHCEDW